MGVPLGSREWEARFQVVFLLFTFLCCYCSLRQGLVCSSADLILMVIGDAPSLVFQVQEFQMIHHTCLLFIYFQSESYCIDQAGLKLRFLLPQSSESYNLHTRMAPSSHRPFLEQSAGFGVRLTCLCPAHAAILPDGLPEDWKHHSCANCVTLSA